MLLQRKKIFLSISGCLLALMLLFAVLHLEKISIWVDYAMFILRPVLIGLAIAYICNPIFRAFERKLFFGVRPHKLRRVLSLIVTYLILVLVLAALIMLIVPQLIGSILDFFNSYESYLRNVLSSVNELINYANTNFSTQIAPLVYEDINRSIADFIEGLDLQSILQDILTYSNIASVLSAVGNALLLLIDILFGVFISLYLLASKERCYAQVMRLRSAFFNDKVNEHITGICTIADRSFGGFFRGKLLDSTIVGILVYAIISVMQVPYALLIAVIVGITDIVPIIGPFIGVIPSAVIILLTDPIKVIPFLLCILIVQQIDGNIIAPKILGENTGVSSLCVMIAITVMGALWGLAGMILGVPLFATAIDLFNGFMNSRLKQKGLPTETENYYGAQTKERISVQKKRQKNSDNDQKPALGSVRSSYETDEAARVKIYALARKHHLLANPSKQLIKDFHEELRALEKNK